MMSLLIGYRKGALGMNNLVQKVSEYMQEHHMVEDGQKIVVGVSGGADSMGLLTVLSELAEYFPIGCSPLIFTMKFELCIYNNFTMLFF